MRLRVSTGAHGTPSAVSRSSHSAARRVRSTSWIIASRSLMCFCRSAGVAKRGSSSHSGRSSARVSDTHSRSVCTAALM